jgi:hypothetical protein
MKTYQRILVPMPADGRGEILLRRAAELLPAGRSNMMVVQVIDNRSGFDSDGPAGRLAGERVARRVPGAKKRLDLLLARNNLGWAESRILCGSPRPAMTEFIRAWRPDLVVTCARVSPEELAHDLGGDQPDVLTVKCRGLFGRLGEAFAQAAHGHA